MQICIDLLSKAQRKQKSDLTVLRFARNFIQNHPERSQRLLPSISNILKELSPGNF
jgi:hypothetical protein